MNNGGVPLDVLAHRASEERNRIHQSVGELKELKSNVEANVAKAGRKAPGPGAFLARAGAASLVALVLGYGLAGIFVD